MYVNTEDGSVRRIDQLTEFVGHRRHSTVVLCCLCHILGDTDNANNIILCVSTCSRIDEEVSNFLRLRTELELVITCFNTLESIVQNFVN